MIGYLCCVFVGVIIGMGVLALFSVNRCEDCSYREAIRSDVYDQMDEETT